MSRITDPHQQIAIDGPAASGKSSVARRVADELGAFYVNTGEMYRTLTWLVRQAGLDPDTQVAEVSALLAAIDIFYEPRPEGLVLTCNGRDVDRQAIRAPTVTAWVSLVARIPAVRDWMLERQRHSARLGLIVMEGRDIGTVVFPAAKWKFFLSATAEERARRRLAQAGETAAGATLESVAAEIRERDHLDSTRAVAPLRKAADAMEIDTSDLSIEHVVERITRIVQG